MRTARVRGGWAWVMAATDDDIPEDELLDLRTWLVALGRLEALLSHQPDAVHLARALRQAFHLAQLAPGPIRRVLTPACREEEFERLVDTGELERAARLLVPPGLPITVLKTSPAHTVVLRADAFDAAGTWVSADPAAALLGAWFSCSVAAGQALIESAMAPMEGPHRSRRETHPLPSRH